MPPNTYSRDQIVNGDRAKASAWARSMGYPVPTAIDGCLALFLVVVGLFVWIIPGLVILVILLSMNDSYNKEMDKLVARWIDAGKPEPGIARNEVSANVRRLTSNENSSITELDEIKKEMDELALRWHDTEKTTQKPFNNPSMIDKLAELEEMRNRSLVNEEEYQALRKKTLGL